MGKKKENKLGNLEVYGGEEEEHKNKEKKDGILKRLWKATVFPEIIEEKKKKEAYNKQLHSEAQALAREEARDEIKKKLVEEYKQKEIAKATKKKGDWSKKLAEGFSMGSGSGDNKFVKALGGGGGDMFSDEKMSRMLGSSGRGMTETEISSETGSHGILPQDKINKMMSLSETPDVEYATPKEYATRKKKSTKKTSTKKKSQKEKYDNFEEKMKKMLS